MTESADTIADKPQRPCAIRVRDLVQTFGGPRAILDGINLDIYRGETLVIMGGSGCGKSTFLRHMIGSLQPDSGDIELLGQSIIGIEEEQLNEIRKRFGILFQSGALFNSMNLRDNVAMILMEHTDLPEETIDIMVKIKLEMVGLREHWSKLPSEISGGMKKRAGLARALALDPQILFYDEPSAGLDPVTSAEIDQLMISLSRQLGVTSVVVTHEMDSAFTIADRMVMLDKGRVLKIGTRQEFEQIRDSTSNDLSTDEALIRQFLTGSFEGPLTQRKQTSNYAEDLLGLVAPQIASRPAVTPTRAKV
ncbi:MAG TPA: ABC transporter ATP-binding protein [Phycisphaerales bacterium]|nr:ABC transporter ATP-binding protein [Phycisphaerales bacterium]HCD32726.1 ABC transporter ATP-binding protein [Phycisphaerales bacterium]|tara:strand:+ start:610 stop:1530 length:921 start_codon:yes stop_codon:yes gene_type:complete